MNEDVLIILNIRQLQKKNLANELSEELSLRRYSCAILEPTENLSEIILERNPRVVVLDYVLGDYSSALDVLPAVRGEDNPNPPSVVLWTDDPSTSVAVTAMKLGAKDYVQITGNRDVSRALSSIERCLNETSSIADNNITVPKVAKTDLIGDTASWRQCVQTTESYASSKTNCCILLGPRGSGRSALARHFHLHRDKPGQLIEIELDLWTGELEQIFGSVTYSHRPKLLSDRATVFIDHAEFDTGPLLAEFESTQGKRANGDDSDTALVIGTTCRKTAQAWQQLVSAKIIEIPGLENRIEDIWPLLRAFIQEAKKLSAADPGELSSDMVTHLASLPWPGNTKQLRDVVFEASMLDLDIEIEIDKKLPARDKKTLSQFLYAKKTWEEQLLRTPVQPDARVVLNALEKSGGDFRIAAAMVGAGVPQVRNVFNSRSNQQ